MAWTTILLHRETEMLAFYDYFHFPWTWAIRISVFHAPVGAPTSHTLNPTHQALNSSQPFSPDHSAGSHISIVLYPGVLQTFTISPKTPVKRLPSTPDLCQSSLSHAFHQKTQLKVPGPAGGCQAGSKAWQSQAATGQGVGDWRPRPKTGRRRTCMFSPTKLQFLLKREDIELNDLYFSSVSP